MVTDDEQGYLFLFIYVKIFFFKFLKLILYFMKRTVHAVVHMNSTDKTALLTVMLAKHITSCDNVFLKAYFLLPTYRVFRPIFNCFYYIKIIIEIN
jgi:hypothetical protein